MDNTRTRLARTAAQRTNDAIGFDTATRTITAHRVTTVTPTRHQILATTDQVNTVGARALRHLARDLINARTSKDRAAWSTLASLATSITKIRGRELGLAADSACDAVAMGTYTLAQTRIAFADYLASGDARAC